MIASCVLAVLAVAAGGGAAPAPQWLREAEVFNGWYSAWTDEAISRMRGLPFVVGVPPDKAVIEKAHKVGTRVLVYLTFYQWPPNDVYQGAKLADHPDWVMIRPDGKEGISCFDSSDNPGWRTVCSNSPAFRKYVLDYTRRLMKLGADGVFVDNAHQDAQPCQGPKFGRHSHIDAAKDNLRAYCDLLRAARSVVKEFGQDKALIANPGGPYAELAGVCDAQMLESYICTHASDKRWHDDARILEFARAYAPFIEKGNGIVALSYIGHTKNPPREDAFYCYAWSRLSGFVWADWFTSPRSAGLLFVLRLGKPIGPMQTGDNCHTRLFEHGMVAASGNSGEGRFALSAAEHPRVLDVFEGRHLEPSGSDQYRISLPPGQGRVYLFH